MPEATFDPNWGSMPGGWLPEYTNGQLTGWWRPAALDQTRGANQQGVQAGSDYGFEYVPADEINGGEPAPESVEYRTGGTSLVQNKPRGGAFMEKAVPAVLGAIIGGGALSAAGFGPYAGAVQGDMGIGGGLLGGGTAATPEITEAMLTGANATSDPIAYLNAQAGWTAADPAYMSTLTTIPAAAAGGAAGSAAGSAAGTAAGKAAGTAAAGGATSTLVDKAADLLGVDPGLLGDSLKFLLPTLTAAGLYSEAKNANGKENPQDVFTRDWGRNRLSNPKPMPSPVTGLYREQMTGLLGQAPSDTLQQLKAKRYY